MTDLDQLCRNAVDVVSKEEFERLLVSSKKEKKPLRVKAGFDPSAPDIHLGHTVLLRKLRQFQDLGHKVIFIIGDTTARVGDPTGQTKTRPILTEAQITENAKTYQDQAFKILDKDPKKIEIVRNSQWLSGPEMFRVLYQVIWPQVTVDQLLVREDFDKRRQAHRPIAIRELMYPILQGYDSVMVKADIELGGTDQKFNLLMGRDIQSMHGQKPQLIMTLPLLVGLDGAQKMSKSLGNYVAVNDSSKDMFGKLMSIPDTLMPAYFNLLTDESGEKIQQDIQSGKLHPKEAKKKLAEAITAFYHGREKAKAEAIEFERVFSDKRLPESPKELVLNVSSMLPADLLKMSLVVASTSDAIRLIEQGGVSLNDKRVTDAKSALEIKDGDILKAGKKAFFKLIVTKLR